MGNFERDIAEYVWKIDLHTISTGTMRSHVFATDTIKRDASRYRPHIYAFFLLGVDGFAYFKWNIPIFRKFTRLSWVPACHFRSESKTNIKFQSINFSVCLCELTQGLCEDVAGCWCLTFEDKLWNWFIVSLMFRETLVGLSSRILEHENNKTFRVHANKLRTDICAPPFYCLREFDTLGLQCIKFTFTFCKWSN